MPKLIITANNQPAQRNGDGKNNKVYVNIIGNLYVKVNNRIR